MTPYFQQKLKHMYNAAIEDARQEEELLRKALEKINDIRSIRNERRIQAKIIILSATELFKSGKDTEFEFQTFLEKFQTFQTDRFSQQLCGNEFNRNHEVN